MRLSKAKQLLVIMLIGLALIGGFAAFKVYRLNNPYLDREVAGDIVISSEWQEIVFNQPLKPEREVQKLLLNFAEPQTPDYNTWKLRFADGAQVIPEAQLIDHQSNSYPLDRVSSLGEMGVGLRAGELPKDKSYPKMRVRSDKPIKVSAVTWRCYNPWDRK